METYGDYLLQGLWTCGWDSLLCSYIGYSGSTRVRLRGFSTETIAKQRSGDRKARVPEAPIFILHSGEVGGAYFKLMLLHSLSDTGEDLERSH